MLNIKVEKSLFDVQIKLAYFKKKKLKDIYVKQKLIMIVLRKNGPQGKAGKKKTDEIRKA